MNPKNQNTQESRTSRYNLSVRHPSKWRLIDTLLATPMRLYRYRNLSRQVIEEAAREIDRGRCE